MTELLHPDEIRLFRKYFNAIAEYDKTGDVSKLTSELEYLRGIPITEMKPPE